MATTRLTRGSSRAGGLLALAVICLGGWSPAWAQDEEAARARRFRELYDRATRAYAAKDYGAVVPDLQSAFAIAPVPQLLYNIALAYRRLERWGSARVYFELYRSLDKNIPPERSEAIARSLAEIEESERKQQAEKTKIVEVEKTKLVYVRSEKPPPRWLRPLGITSGVAGLGLFTAGVTLLALDGQCRSAPVAPMLECDQLYSTQVPGAVLTAVGGSLLFVGALSLGLSFRRPARPTVVKEAPDNDLLLLPESVAPAPSFDPNVEPPPAGFYPDGSAKRDAPASRRKPEP